MKNFFYHPFLLVREPALRCSDFDAENGAGILARPDFRAALELASQGFYRSLAERAFNFDRLEAKQQQTVLNYYNRMCYRPTPFGAFASFGLGAWDGGEGDGERKLHRLMDWEALLGYKTPMDRYRLNPTLYRVNSEFRFIRSAVEPGSSRLAFTLEAVAVNPVLAELFKRGLAVIDGNAVIELADMAYLAFLVESQWLLPADPPALIGAPFTGPAPAEGPYYTGLEDLTPGGLAAEWQRPLREALVAAAKLTLPEPPEALETFKKAFSRRYDRRKVPLLEALDPELGIGYAGLGQEQTPSLLKGVVFNGLIASPASPWGKVQQLLLNKWDRQGIRLEPADLAGLAERPVQRSALSVLFRRTGAAGLWLEAVSSGTALAGRFTAFSAGVCAAVREIARQEERANPGVVFAELIQLSDHHVDNISRRESLYSHELPINTFSLLPADRQLALADLLVSVTAGRVLLESVSRGREVVPRLSSAYNYTRNELAVFRFLTDLQEQGGHARLPDPERFFPGLAHYPRLSFGAVIFSPAKWYLSLEQLAAPEIAALHQQLDWPDRVVLAEADRELVFDLRRPAEAVLLRDALRGRSRALIREYLPPPGDRNRQYLAFLYQDRPVYAGSDPLPAVKVARRSFLPGSNWWYLQLFCSPAAGDELLARHIAPLIRSLKKDGPLLWFFVRYREGGYHIRLRIRTTGARLPQVIKRSERVFAPLLRRGLLSRVVAVTYEPEWERYGRQLPKVEQLFYAGSELVINQLKKHRLEILPFVLVQVMVGKLKPARRRVFLATMVQHFYREFRADAALRRSLGDKYRSLRSDLAVPAGFYREFEQALDRLGPLSEPLLADLIHLTLNRVFSERQREQELLIYYCVWKLSLRAGS